MNTITTIAVFLVLRHLHKQVIYFCPERLAHRGFRNASRVASSDTALIINPNEEEFRYTFNSSSYIKVCCQSRLAVYRGIDQFLRPS